MSQANISKGNDKLGLLIIMIHLSQRELIKERLILLKRAVVFQIPLQKRIRLHGNRWNIFSQVAAMGILGAFFYIFIIGKPKRIEISD